MLLSLSETTSKLEFSLSFFHKNFCLFFSPSLMAASSSSSSSSSSSAPCRTWKYDVFPSFSGEDVRQKFLSHLLEKLDSKLITTFKDNGIERSRLIETELFSAIKESRISIVIFSKKYASSTWCLNELVAIYNRFKDQMDQMDQMVIPVFYEVDPSHVRKQTGEFGQIFKMTCEGISDDQKQSWIQALTEVAKIAGFDSQNQQWETEAAMIEEISKDVFNKVCTTSDDFRDFVGIDTHVEEMNSLLCLESGEVKMVGIVGTSGIGKSTIARALFSRLKSRFDRQAFVFYKRNIQDKIKADFEIRLSWANQFLSKILGIKVEIDSVGMVEQRLKDQKVLVVLDDVDEIELLETLVGDTTWFGYGSRIIVVTQDKSLLKSHGIDLIYEVPFPSQEVALEMFCRSAFRQKSRDGFMELAVEVAKAAGNLPLGLNVLGSSLRGRDKKAWVEMMPMIQDGLIGKIGKILEICYERLDSKDEQDLFLYIACLFNGESVSYISNLLEGVYTSVITRLRMLAGKSLIRISTPEETVEMHIMLQKLGRDIVRRESDDPGKRRFLVELEDIRKVLSNKTVADNVLGICLDVSNISGPLFIDEISLEGMCNLQFIKFYGTCRPWWYHGTGYKRPVIEVILKSNRGLVYLPPKLRLLHWHKYPWKYIPSNFKAECLVELVMEESNLKRLWRGTLPLQRLQKMDLYGSTDLEDIPNLSKAKNLKVLGLLHCSNVLVYPEEVNFESLEDLRLTQCSSWFKCFPLTRTAMASWLIENITRVTYLTWHRCPLRCMPSNFLTKHLVVLDLEDSQFEKLWEGVQPLENLKSMDLSNCENLKEIPDLSKATKLKMLDMSHCKSLEVLPTDVNLVSLEVLILAGCKQLRSFPQISTNIRELDLWRTAIEEVPPWIENMSKLKELDMSWCGMLEVPTDIYLESLEELDLSHCESLRSFPQISTRITKLNLYRTAVEEVPSWIENMSKLKELDMRWCERLKNISPSMFKLRHLRKAYFSFSELTSFSDASVVATVACITDSLDFPSNDLKDFQFNECFNLDQNARELILSLPIPMFTILPGEEVPTYFTHRSSESSPLIITLPQSSPSHEVLRFKACVVIGSSGHDWTLKLKLKVRCRFRGLSGVKLFDTSQYGRDHMLVFNFGLADFEPNSHLSASAAIDHKSSQSELDYNIMEFEVFKITGDPQSSTAESKMGIKGCGIRLLNASLR